MLDNKESRIEAAETPAGPGKKRLRRGIFLLPNLFTTAALFAGFYAIVAAMNGQFDVASAAIFVAMVMDGADGRIARMTNTQSAFGAEYDSLSDVISFGLAPALVTYEWALSGMGKLGWLAAFFYAAATALRLARFNTQLGTADKRFFQGLPCPMAAAVIAGLVWLATDYGASGQTMIPIAFITTVLTGVLMVSNTRYYSFKDLDLRGRVPFISVLAVVLLFVFISTDPPLVLFLASLGYAISGPVLTLIHIRRRRLERRAAVSSLTEDAHNSK
jgi:CDP-diacylglycerol--serine O-phosphatidyltransferase